MNFYTGQHKFYCGIDLHARKMYLCILDEKGEVKLHRNMNTDREVFLKAIEPYQRGCRSSRRMYVRLVLDRRSLSEREYSLCPRSCSLYESYPWRQGKERQDRFT